MEDGNPFDNSAVNQAAGDELLVPIFPVRKVQFAQNPRKGHLVDAVRVRFYAGNSLMTDVDLWVEPVKAQDGVVYVSNIRHVSNEGLV